MQSHLLGECGWVCRISCRISPFGGGELKDLGGSSLGPLGVKNKVSKNFGGGVTDFFFLGGGGGVPPKKRACRKPWVWMWWVRWWRVASMGVPCGRIQFILKKREFLFLKKCNYNLKVYLTYAMQLMSINIKAVSEL